jgi:glycine oxidase
MKTCDVLIAGGGIIGGAIAFELAGHGLRVVLCDSQSPGREASWAAAGMLSPPPDSADAIPLVPLARASLARYPQFIAAVEEASGLKAHFRPVGAIEALFSGDAERELSTLIAIHRGLGLNTEALPLDEAFQIEPALGRDARACAILSLEACVDNRALTVAVLAAAKSRGVEIRTNSPVESLLCAANRCVGAVVAGERVEGAHTVIAAGCFSTRIEGVARYAPVRPVRGQMVALRSERVEIGHVVRSERGYIVPRGGGLCVAGSTLENAGFEKRVTPNGINKILNAALEIAPRLADAEIVETWCGLRPDTPDHLPVLGPTEVEGLLIATGHYRNGILLTPITAKLIGDWIAGTQTILDCDAFSPMRFADAAKIS